MASQRPVYLGEQPPPPVEYNPYIPPPKDYQEPKSTACCCCKITTCISVLTTFRLIFNIIGFVAIILFLIAWEDVGNDFDYACGTDESEGYIGGTNYTMYSSVGNMSAMYDTDAWFEEMGRSLCAQMALVRQVGIMPNLLTIIGMVMWIMVAFECAEILMNLLVFAAVGYVKPGLLLPRLIYDVVGLVIGYISVGVQIVTVATINGGGNAILITLLLSFLAMIWPTYIVCVEYHCHKYLKWMKVKA